MIDKRSIMEDIFDLIVGVTIPDGTVPQKWNGGNCSLNGMRKQFEIDARKRLKRFIGKKNIEWDIDTIYIGRNFKIKLEE